MKRLIVALALILFVSGCGMAEREYDAANYESITNECGTIELYSGGVAVKTFNNACILYASADTDTLFFTVNGDTKYWQGDAFLAITD